MRALAWVFVAGGALLAGGRALHDDGGGPPPGGHGELVEYAALANACAMPARPEPAARREWSGASGQVVTTARTVGRSSMFADPIRTIKDPYPSFAAVAVDPERNEVVFTDESLFQVLVYDRLESTRPGVNASQPKRVIAGERTNIEFQSGVYVDQITGEIYAVNNDIRDTTVVFAPGANGDVTPARTISTPHGTFDIAVAEEHHEVLLTIQHDAAVVAYRKNAGEADRPTRVIQGEKTKLADPHGIAYDPMDDVIFIANFGSRHDVDGTAMPSAAVPASEHDEGEENWPLDRDWGVPGSGTIGPPSIVIHRRTARGNAPPLRVIEGPATQLNWPTGLAFDADRRELYVANDMGPSVLVFDADAHGNTAPKRVLKGGAQGWRIQRTLPSTCRMVRCGSRTSAGIPPRSMTSPPPATSRRGARSEMHRPPHHPS